MGKSHLGQASGDHEYIRAAQVQLRELARTCAVRCTLEIQPDTRLGVLQLQFRAYEGRDPANSAALASYAATWPNVQDVKFTAFLFQCSVKFSQLVEDSLRGLWNAPAE